MKTHRTQKFIAAALISSFILSACGIRGELQTPPPLWGDKAKQSEAETEKPKGDSSE